jgi:hypothetical protein
MLLRAVFAMLLLTSLCLAQNPTHAPKVKKQIHPKRTQSSVAVPAPKADPMNKELGQLEKDTSRTIGSPKKAPQQQTSRVSPVAKTPTKQRSAINFNYQQRTTGRNTTTAVRPK